MIKNSKLLKMIERANMTDFDMLVDEFELRLTFADDRFLFLKDLNDFCNRNKFEIPKTIKGMIE